MGPGSSNAEAQQRRPWSSSAELSIWGLPKIGIPFGGVPLRDSISIWSINGCTIILETPISSKGLMNFSGLFGDHRWMAVG